MIATLPGKLIVITQILLMSALMSIAFFMRVLVLPKLSTNLLELVIDLEKLLTVELET
jgi:hypothetical protein